MPGRSKQRCLLPWYTHLSAPAALWSVFWMASMCCTGRWLHDEPGYPEALHVGYRHICVVAHTVACVCLVAFLWSVCRLFD